MMTQEIKDIYETWFLKTTGFLPEQAIDALEEKDKHYAVAIGQLSKRNQELEAVRVAVLDLLRMGSGGSKDPLAIIHNEAWDKLQAIVGDNDA